ncbi:MAG: DUF2336 domain-containing protein [Alphaproteobacteria bacterium]|nr:DUF2336 domain-containing protein [Alphaproteobacteria bacterium]
MNQPLSLQDVERLLSDGSPHARAATATKIATLVDMPSLGAQQRRDLQVVLNLFARDAEIMVRAALAEQLKSSPNLPVELAARLARDTIEVATPILASSDVLTDDLLVEIIAAGDAGKQLAIAGRSTVSATVSEVLIEKGQEVAVARLAGNDGAQIADGGFERMLERFANSETVATGLANRQKLPPTIAEKVIARVSNRLSADLVARHALPERVADQLVDQAREKATAGYAAMVGEAEASRALARQMHQNGKLTSTIVLRSLCMGDLPFFEAAMSIKAGIPLASTQTLIHDVGGRGIKAITERAQLPTAFLPAVRAAVGAILETDYDGMPGDRVRFMKRVIERVLTQVEEVGAETLDYLLAKLSEPETQSAA